MIAHVKRHSWGIAMADTKHPKVLLLVKFKSKLSDEEVVRRYKERLPKFRDVPGLVQKYYVQDPVTGEWGGLYCWDSQESLDAYMTSDLRKTIPDTYEFAEPPRIEVINVIDILHP